MGQFLLIYGFLLAAVHSCYPGMQNSARMAEADSTYKIMFYNVENLFDVTDDTLTADDDFTPGGTLHWTYKRYNTKLNNLSKVIIAIGGWDPPDIIGLCEVENLKVLQDLVHNTSLAKFRYGIVHEDSPDRRGIDVAMIYNQNTVRLLESKNLKVTLKDLHTRDILHVKVLMDDDTCHLFINHWPSRSSGQLETEKGRFAAARLLKHATDSLFSINSQANVMIMGDFNDDPQDESLVSILQVKSPEANTIINQLYNLTSVPKSGAVRGTLKYQGNWNAFDQIIVSGSLISGDEGLSADKNGYKILQNNFLLEPDATYNGFKPFRTYNGFRYTGGFSDHLPVFIEIRF